ncbi:hypothetical protein [Actinoplanes couchii]|uniref:Uncharacterized protein n=1 Tax=Actinoplanes couchii TaxID=403638 RepID=A0ABQ3X8P1_9ACTN|nr:hypothetical protein [Actinoplanes couchii]MDR6320106.1 hypothetical protein [Actinoplanes couchii]GID54879.1 hypothetical protein Aco03nite_032830 [Actinoplanes couchii]
MTINLFRALFVSGAALTATALGATSAEAATKPVKNLNITVNTVDNGLCNHGVLEAVFETPLRRTTLFDLTVTTSRGKIFKPVYSDYTWGYINGGCVTKALVKDVRNRRLTGKVRAFTSDGEFVGQRTARIKLIHQTVGC